MTLRVKTFAMAAAVACVAASSVSAASIKLVFEGTFTSVAPDMDQPGVLEAGTTYTSTLVLDAGPDDVSNPPFYFFKSHKFALSTGPGEFYETDMPGFGGIGFLSVQDPSPFDTDVIVATTRNNDVFYFSALEDPTATALDGAGLRQLFALAAGDNVAAFPGPVSGSPFPEEFTAFQLSVLQGNTTPYGDCVTEAQCDSFATIDRFSVAAVPLPASGIMLIAALGGFGALSAKRRKDKRHA